MLASCSLACDANNLSFKALSQLWGIEHTYVDVPYDISEDSIAYVADELRELTVRAEDIFGRKADKDMLQAAVARSQNTLSHLAYGLPRRQGRLAASDMGNEMQQALAVHLALGTPESEQMAQQMAIDFAQAPAYKGLSLVWVHTAPFFSEPLQQALNQNSQAQIIASEMLFDQVPFKDEGDFLHGPDTPFEAMAERLVRNSYNGSASRRAAHILKLCEQTHADGAVIFCHWGCKETAGAAQLIRRTLERAGFPALVLDGDGCERANNMEGQMSTRMSAFLEMLKDQRMELAHG
jgi:benzoyl-CoA reductase/2-hydroxyglutaryl-CoA dehydratase subunit BcrC/BadD/HgdB